MKKTNSELIIKILITALIILLPINDILRNTFVKDIEILNISIVEIFNIIIILFTFILSIKKFNKKNLMLFLLYFIMLILYIILHYFNIIQFDKSIFPKANFDFLIESYYIFRVYVLPLLLLSVMVINKEIFNLNYFVKISKILIIIISGSIVVLNILRISFGSYLPNDIFVEYNLFDYFSNHNLGKSSLTRGWFNSTNEIALVLLMLMPFNILNHYRKSTFLSSLLLFSQVLSMIILGTRISSIGGMLIFVLAFFTYLFVSLIRRVKLNYKFLLSYLIIIFVSVVFICFSPILNLYTNVNLFNKGDSSQNSNQNVVQDNIQDENTDGNFNINYEEEYLNLEKIVEKCNKKEIANYITYKKWTFGINELFLDMYPVENDIEFYLQIAKRDRNINNDSRKMKITILDRIEQRNNQFSDSILGLGYTLNFMDVERDYVYQYYLFGIYGLVLLVLPYFVIYFKNILLVFKQKKIFEFTTLLLMMSIFLGLIGAYFSGHLFGYVTPMYCLVICLTAFNNSFYEGRNNKKTVMILQNTNALGGVFYVNNSIIEYYKDSYNFVVSTLRKAESEIGNYDGNIQHFIINKKARWNLIQGKYIKNELKNRKIFKAFSLLVKRVVYKINLKLDFIKQSNLIESVNPDVIICSQYELLQSIPNMYLRVTYVHQHMSFSETLNNRDNIKIFNKYKSKINSFIWLSKKTCNKAIKYGFTNSMYIYNPVRIKSTISNYKNKNCIYIGRFENTQKRLDLLVDIFIDTINKYSIKDWKLLLYGYGHIDEGTLDKIMNSKNIKLCGKTDDVEKSFHEASISLNTSSFEGFPMTILEGNACGVPTISFDFGESSKETIIDSKTGLICSDKNDYINKLANLMKDNLFRKKLSEGAYEYSKKFEVDIVMKKWKDIFEG